MGNIGSQVGNISQKYKLEPNTHTSLPRNLPRVNHQPRVLPNKEATPKLRPTENGEILHAGGTLTGRQQFKVPGGNFMNVKEKVAYVKELHENNRLFSNQKEQMKRFGSEPDLRNYLKQERNEHKPKKYRAPPRPVDQNPPQDLQNWDGSPQAKRPGLFKTRIESRKQVSNIVSNLSPTIVKRNKINNEDLEQIKENRRSLPEIQKSFVNDFAAELKEATKRLQTIKVAEHQTKEEPKPPEVKKFYFGMDDCGDEFLQYEIKDYTISSIPFPCNGSNSDISDYDESYYNNPDKISLHLRPILPKKQPEIPRFSPGSAWKLLCSIDSGSNMEDSTNMNDDEFGLIEDRIEKVSNSPPLMFQPLELRLSQDKSGDSGISGDGSPKAFNHYRNEKSWTPQQDLGEDSSSEDELKSNSMPFIITNKPHIFSLSLPRDHTTSNANTNEAPPNMKRSVSGAFPNGLFEPEENFNIDPSQNSNWFLSKSAPNSLNGFSSLETYQKQNDSISSLVPMSGQQGKGRIMYLPQGDGKNLKIEEHFKPDFELSTSKNNKRTNPKKFSFQNTVRQIERRRLAERLAREVEKKEQQRRQEIEAMQRIEEEFQRKRSRYDPLYTKNQTEMRKTLITIGEKNY